MPRGVSVVKISMTEMPHFRRLVQFLEDVHDYAHREVDLDVKDLVEGCLDDLLRIKDETDGG